jgi:hypothetical protein
MKFLRKLFHSKPAPAPCNHNPLDLGNGFVVETRDDFLALIAEVKIPIGGWISFTYNGIEVFRIDQNGGRNIP